jgi:hypothetical protein
MNNFLLAKLACSNSFFLFCFSEESHEKKGRISGNNVRLYHKKAGITPAFRTIP